MTFTKEVDKLKRYDTVKDPAAVGEQVNIEVGILPTEQYPLVLLI
jgi:hypothetical protein